MFPDGISFSAPCWPAPCRPAGFGSVPSLRALGYKPFYDKLNVAAIGCGGQGGVDLNDAAQTENIVALCDVDESRAPAI